jgi:hypothetical protein
VPPPPVALPEALNAYKAVLLFSREAQRSAVFGCACASSSVRLFEQICGLCYVRDNSTIFPTQI